MYDHPNNIFVAGFIGSPAMNFIRARIERDDGKMTLRLLHQLVGHNPGDQQAALFS
jgi:multiple sugar transport system ATP-binding protein